MGEIGYSVPSTAAITTRNIAVSVAVVILGANSSAAITYARIEPTVCISLALLISRLSALNLRTRPFNIAAQHAVH